MTIRLLEPRSSEILDPGPIVSDPGFDRDAIWRYYQSVRRTTEALCAPLEIEDYVVQSMADASPVKWHLAHTSWFFETFVLGLGKSGQAPVNSQYAYLFNSYYNAVGERIARDRRGLLSRPTVADVYGYRTAIDGKIEEFLDRADEVELARVRATLVLGLHHEQQHQELILTDLKHALAGNPLRPVYRKREKGAAQGGVSSQVGWASFPAALRSIGHEGDGFAFDNETPRHPEHVASFALADRLVTNQEFLAFMEDGGYRRPEFWLSDGWAARTRNGWGAPLYWELEGGRWRVFTLAGTQDLDPSEPVCHVSFYEADAFARWAGDRLATEAEWETAATADGQPPAGNFLESDRLHPAPGPNDGARSTFPRPAQLLGDVWEWTQSPYTPYPGFRPTAGALGEYNGKFMCNQIVLRGGSCATPRSHIRPTYRNFFPPEARWQFSGIRLARDV
jgi:ergothioneine biosynthesis protein EgtB